jgi:hypothetical protein
LNKFLHDWIGFGAAAMVVAALLYFLSPWVENFIGPERTGVLQVVIVGLLAIRGFMYFVRFLGVISRRKD